MPKRAKIKPETIKKRPDPAFKQILTDEARKIGLKRGPTELQIAQTTSSDMLLLVPQNVDLTATLFEFFRAVNVIEFKSGNDPAYSAKSTGTACQSPSFYSDNKVPSP
jgi:hypothetical protein